MASRCPVIYVVEPFGGSIRWHNPSLPLVHWDDYALTRGDGIFESILIVDGHPANIDRHAQRFITSAEALNLPTPQIDSWIKATEAAAAEFGEGEAKCTWTYSRGRASTGIPTAWVAVQEIADSVLEQRQRGVRVMVAERGWTIPSELPAKTLNYAATMATLRLAKDRGFDDVIFTEPETGLLLEGATSTIVSFKGDKVRTPAHADILPGTTQAAVFDYAKDHGLRCKAREMTLDHLRNADSVWLVSSVRGAARVRRLGDEKLKAPDNEAEIRSLITAAMQR